MAKPEKNEHLNKFPHTDFPFGAHTDFPIDVGVSEPKEDEPPPPEESSNDPGKNEDLKNFMHTDFPIDAHTDFPIDVGVEETKEDESPPPEENSNEFISTVNADLSNDDVSRAEKDVFTQGSDVLYGVSENDVLLGYFGSDEPQGGGNSFGQLSDDANGNEAPHDFSISGEVDALDISTILEQDDPLSDAITDFVQVTESEGSTTVSVDVDGGGDNAVQVAAVWHATGLSDEENLVDAGAVVV